MRFGIGADGSVHLQSCHLYRHSPKSFNLFRSDIQYGMVDWNKDLLMKFRFTVTVSGKPSIFIEMTREPVQMNPMESSRFDIIMLLFHLSIL